MLDTFGGGTLLQKCIMLITLLANHRILRANSNVLTGQFVAHGHFASLKTRVSIEQECDSGEEVQSSIQDYARDS